MTGALVLVAALVATALLALVMQRRNGRFTSRPGAATEGTADPVEPGGSGELADLPRVTADEIGAALGDRLTLVQFSSAFCSPCRATRALLTDVVSTRADVAHVEVDAESHLDLVRRLNILRTPTVLVVDADGVVLSRASGLPRRDQVVAVLDA
ncbi:thioredoxin family protein [Aeromicrobium sp. Leaf272]|uniref:thioredoxin family protein n=1 Tax=Aeromicrobium sp. Leaf272 TaxID=1736317 RepID=UPI0006F30ACD|nr:thioredoxin family protein [Aeromicrobium sp. Leaf272]KQP29249.1 thioredoxin [Aeromicrobium sp. Leaf272]